MPNPIFTRFLGMNDFDPPAALGPDECQSADNVEFWTSPLGARRLGCTPITISGTLAAQTAITFLHRYLPSNDETAAVLFAWGVTSGVSSSLEYKDTAWHTVSFVDAPNLTNPYPYQMSAQNLHGKMFVAYKSGVDRLHVWDGTTLRRCGLAQPVAPAVANSGSGTYSGTRYFRVRFTVQSGGKTILRSEPSTSTTFSPSGSGSGAQITKPASIGENETHWEIEASLDNSNFYRIGTNPVGTTTFTDTTSASIGYGASTTNVLSDTIGNYSTIPSGKYLLVDDDRLLVFGSFEDPTKASHMWWTVVGSDPTGVGNDERIPVATSNEMELDGFEGGEITGAAGPVNGANFVFKRTHVYRAVRTGQLTRAYDVRPMTKSVGAIPGSVIRAVDESGNAAVYFLDDKTGAHRIGQNGMLWAGRDIWNTWQRYNRSANLLCSRALYFPDKKQVHWWVSVDGSNTPNLQIVLQTNNCQVDIYGLRKGWTRRTGLAASALAATLFSDNIEANTTRSLKLVPMIAVGNKIERLENGTTDDGQAFTSTLVSSPRFSDEGVLGKYGVMTGGIAGNAAAGAVVNVTLVRDFGVESQGKDYNLTPVAAEDPVLVARDDLAISECHAMQLQLSDGTGNAGTWQVQRIDLKPRDEETA